MMRRTADGRWLDKSISTSQRWLKTRGDRFEVPVLPAIV